MKQSGLKNRFDSDELSSAWTFWIHCLWCWKSSPDCFHHIISPSSQSYKEGHFNNSILNSCPIHNEGCHLYNPALHKIENEKILLRSVLLILLVSGYQLTLKDYSFIENYSELYTIDKIGLDEKNLKDL